MKKASFLLSAIAMAAVATTTYALNPSKEYKVTPDKYGMKYKEVKIPTVDGAVLNGWYFEQPKKTTSTIIISGSGDGNMADYLELTTQFLSIEYNVMLYDYRGYGKSSEFKIASDVYIYPEFIKDLNAVLDFLRKYNAITKFDLYGTGIGAGLSIGVGANRTETKKVIADGPWISLEAAKKKIREKYAKEVIIPFGYDKNHEPVYGMEKPKSGMKLMVIISPKDEMIGPADIKGLKGIDETYTVKNSNLNSENFSTDKNAYFEKVTKFLKG